MNTWARDLKIASNADRDIMDVTAREVWIGPERYRFANVSLSPDLGENGLLGLDTDSKAADTWYDLILAATDDGLTLTAMWVLEGGAPILPDHYGRYEVAGTFRVNGDGDLYRIKNAAGSPDFDYNELINAGDFLLKNAVVGAADTWEDIDASDVAPLGCESVLLDVQIYSTAPAHMILRIKDKDLDNITNIGDTISVAGATRTGCPVRVGVDASQVFQIQANSTLRTVVIALKSFRLRR